MFTFPMQDGGAGAAGALVKMKDMPSGGGGTLVYFGCKDCSVEVGRVVASGGTVIRPKFSIGPHGNIALASDPDGNTIGFHSME